MKKITLYIPTLLLIFPCLLTVGCSKHHTAEVFSNLQVAVQDDEDEKKEDDSKKNDSNPKGNSNELITESPPTYSSLFGNGKGTGSSHGQPQSVVTQQPRGSEPQPVVTQQPTAQCSNCGKIALLTIGCSLLPLSGVGASIVCCAGHTVAGGIWRGACTGCYCLLGLGYCCCYCD